MENTQNENKTASKTVVTASCIVDRAMLLPLLTDAAGFTLNKHSIFASVCLSFGSTLGVLATDGVRWFVSQMACESEKTAHLTLACCDAKKLRDIVKALPEGGLKLTGTLTTTRSMKKKAGRCEEPSVVVESLIQIVTASGEYNIKGPDSTFFTAAPAAPSDWATYDAAALSSALSTVKPFVLKDVMLPHMNAALIEAQPSLIRALGTDGLRLAKMERVAQNRGVATRFLVPLVGVDDLLDRCKVVSRRKASAAGIELAIKGNTVFWRGEGSTYYAVQSECEVTKFPPYNQVIPRMYERGITVERAAFLAALKRLVVTAEGCALHLPASSEMPPHVMLVETDDGDGQSAKEKLAIELDRFAGVNLKIGMTIKYLTDALDAFNGRTVWIGFNGNFDPIGVKPDRNSGDVFIVMPRRL